MHGAILFDTAVGVMRIAWSEAGISGVALPGPLPPEPGTEPDADAPPDVLDAVGGIRRLLDGERVDLAFARLDLTGIGPFDRAVYEAARRIPAGTTTTYGELAARAGVPGRAQDVGRSLARNPVPVIVPCHRVLAAGGRFGGFSAPGGVRTKLRLLGIEGVVLALEGVTNDPFAQVARTN